MQDLHEMLCAGSTVDDSEEYIISEKLTRTVMAQGEFALVGSESVPNNETPYVIVDGGATTTLTSSFEIARTSNQRRSILIWRKEG